jgi:hypothetical protein
MAHLRLSEWPAADDIAGLAPTTAAGADGCTEPVSAPHVQKGAAERKDVMAPPIG